MSLAFSGANPFANAAFAPFTSANNSIIFAWVKINPLNTARMIVELSDGVDTADYFRLVTDSSNHVLAQVNETAGTAASTSTGTIADTSWHAVAAVFTSSSSRNTGIDGTLNVSPNTTPRTPASIAFTQIGLNIANNQDHSGNIGHVAIWTGGNAFTNTEFALLAAGTNPLTIDRSHLVAYWPMDVAGTVTQDFSGNGHTLTLGGAAAFDADNPVVNAPYNIRAIQNYYRRIRASQ